jgi:ActR/RegA family two-component response regulator
MARIQLLIADAPQRMTLHAMLEAAGHSMVDSSADVVFTDSVETAVKHADASKTFVLATASSVPDAVRAMRDSRVFGYIFVPLQPGEAVLAVEQATRSASSSSETAEAMRPLEDVEMEHIQRVLRVCKHNQAKAARVLGIGRNTLWRKLKRGQESNT